MLENTTENSTFKSLQVTTFDPRLPFCIEFVFEVITVYIKCDQLAQGF